MGHSGRDLQGQSRGGLLHDLGALHHLALIVGAAVLAALLLSAVVMASHQFSYVIQQLMSGQDK